MDAVVLDEIIQRLLVCSDKPPGRQVQLSETEVRQLCSAAKEIFLCQPMLLELEAPLKICGNIHGQFSDLLRLFKYGGFPPQAKYLFLGGYVDYGKQSLETMCLLLAYKIKYPENFFLLRGIHECASISRIYGFYDECKTRYSVKLWKAFNDCFNCLPLAALVEEKMLCMHGGISPDLNSLDQIQSIRRPTDVPDSGLLCDLLWTDPDRERLGWHMNERGVSYTFGPDRVSDFLSKLDLDLICRGGSCTSVLSADLRAVVEDGYEFFADRQLVTIFSAPNFREKYDNAGAMMSVDESLTCSFQILKPATRSHVIKEAGAADPPKKSKLFNNVIFKLFNKTDPVNGKDSVEPLANKLEVEKPEQQSAEFSDQLQPEEEVLGEECDSDDTDVVHGEDPVQSLAAKLEVEKQKDETAETSVPLHEFVEEKLEQKLKMTDIGSVAKDLNEQPYISNQVDYDLLLQQRDAALREAEELRLKIQQESFRSNISYTELQLATNNFDIARKVGEGGFAIVYKGFLRGTVVAVKTLRPERKIEQSGFVQEATILSRVRHPNLITLIGFCLQPFALVYEYLPKGSLEDHLARKDGSSPIPWQLRTHIIAEIRSALIFLHTNKPRPIVHGDLKPDNIFLDANMVSKLGDFGICCFLDDSSTNSFCHLTDHPKGTLGYIDPEYMTTGKLTTQSDVYAFGVIILRLLTGKPARGINEEVQKAIDKRSLRSILDPSAGNWPTSLAKELVKIGLNCSNINRKKRPDLVGRAWRVVEAALT